MASPAQDQAAFPPPWSAAFGLDRLSPFPFADIELAPGVSMRFRWIPPGTFTMGSPEDEPGRMHREQAHPVTLSCGFWLADTPCTQEQWSAVMGGSPSYFKGADLPVESVSWGGCREFVAKLNARHEGLSPRLPTEAEWEYACRAGTTSAFNDGSACTRPAGKDSALDALGWYGENSEDRTHPVRQKEANRWGLYDMHGNVFEWCADWFEEELGRDAVVNPRGPESGRSRVIRGGCFAYFGGCRSAYRNCVIPESRLPILGFRPVAGSAR